MYINVCIVTIAQTYLDRKIPLRVFIEAECVWTGSSARLLLVLARISSNCFLGKPFKENVSILTLQGWKVTTYKENATEDNYINTCNSKIVIQISLYGK